MFDSAVSRPVAGSSLFGSDSGMSLTPVEGLSVSRVAVLKLAPVALQRGHPSTRTRSHGQRWARAQRRYSTNQAAQRFSVALARGSFSSVVVASRGGLGDLGDGHGMQAAVELTAACARRAMAVAVRPDPHDVGQRHRQRRRHAHHARRPALRRGRPQRHGVLPRRARLPYLQSRQRRVHAVRSGHRRNGGPSTAFRRAAKRCDGFPDSTIGQ